jgi:hypothetical protein
LAIIATNCAQDDSPRKGGGNPAPAEFSSLYTYLSNKLATERADLDARGIPRTAAPMGATLLPASSNAGTSLQSPAYEAGTLDYLDQLESMGAETIVLQINYPILTQNFVGAVKLANYQGFYTRVVAAIKAKGLKVLIEHNNSIPGYANEDPTTYYSSINKTTFGSESYAEVLWIIQNLQPDYLSLLTEPDTVNFGSFTMSETDWSGYLTSTISALPAHTTKLGAGCGVWEPQAYLDETLNVSGLDYIDIHFYPMASPTTDYIDRFEERIALIKAEDPTLELIMSETWLFKVPPEELGGSVADPEYFRRDTYSFWETLDQQYLEYMSWLTNYHGFTLMAPFWMQYFFGYLTYGDPALGGFTDKQVLDESYQKAYEGLSAGTTTNTGKTFQTLAQ